MIQLAAGAAAIVSVISLIAALCKWRAHGVEETRRLVHSMRSVFGDVGANHGVDSSVFVSGEGKNLADALGDRRDQLRDRELRRRVDILLERWRQVFAAAPTAQTTPGSAKASPEREHQVAVQLAAATNGYLAVQRVLDRCNELTRWVVGDVK